MANMPNFSLSTPSNATSGAAYGGTLGTGAFNVGGGSASSGGLAAILQQYWPVLAVVGVIVYLRRRK